MDKNMRKIYLIDCILFIGLFIFLYLFSDYIVHNIDSWKESSQYIVLMNTFYIYVLYIFLKSIMGGILLMKSIKNKEIILTRKTIITIYNIIFFILFMLIIIYGIIYYQDFRIKYQVNIFGLLFNEFHLYILTIINIFVNLLGIPMHLIYVDKNILLNKILKYILYSITIFIVLIINFGIIIYVINGSD
jgi:hypothetical protein